MVLDEAQLIDTEQVQMALGRIASKASLVMLGDIAQDIEDKDKATRSLIENMLVLQENALCASDALSAADHGSQYEFFKYFHRLRRSSWSDTYGCTLCEYADSQRTVVIDTGSSQCVQFIVLHVLLLSIYDNGFVLEGFTSCWRQQLIPKVNSDIADFLSFVLSFWIVELFMKLII